VTVNSLPAVLRVLPADGPSLSHALPGRSGLLEVRRFAKPIVRSNPCRLAVLADQQLADSEEEGGLRRIRPETGSGALTRNRAGVVAAGIQAHGRIERLGRFVRGPRSATGTYSAGHPRQPRSGRHRWRGRCDVLFDAGVRGATV